MWCDVVPTSPGYLPKDPRICGFAGDPARVKIDATLTG
jgi:hypothetical protein